jgi:hypothetical protein
MRLEYYLKEERSKARKLTQIYLSSRSLEEKLDAATALIVNLTGLLTNDNGLVSLSSRIAKGVRRE